MVIECCCKLKSKVVTLVLDAETTAFKEVGDINGMT